MNTHRVTNFGAGPAALPLAALEKAQSELLDFDGTGVSLMEHSHRGPAYQAVHQEAKQLLRNLFEITDDYEIIFMQGGASTQFGLLPLNFVPLDRSADYVLTGTWSQKALAEAEIVGKARVLATTENDDGSFTRIPAKEGLLPRRDSAYVHVTSNNTICGSQYHEYPNTGAIPLVADMSSDIGCRPLDVSKFGLIYAGAQKNLGMAGLTIVILKKSLLRRGLTGLPRMLRYETFVDNDSLYNTVPSYAVYMMRNVLSWIDETGGLDVMAKRNREKADTLYGVVDELSEFYRGPVEKKSRSWMNAVFRLPNEGLEAKFIAAAEKDGMVGLKGHRSVGGIRVSMYNACEPSSVRTLVEFMRSFASTHG